MTEQGRKLRTCQAELAQERKLTEHLNTVNQNLVEKNGNQFTQIKGLQEGLRAEISIENKLGKKLRVQEDIVKKLKLQITKQQDNFVTVVGQRDKLRREHDIDLKTISEMRDKSISTGIEANVTNEMVAKIVDAMEGAGYPIASHATTEQFDLLAKMVEKAEGYAVSAEGELEAANVLLTDSVAMIDEIREERE